MIPTKDQLEARIEKFELYEGFQPYHPPFRILEERKTPAQDPEDSSARRLRRPEDLEATEAERQNGKRGESVSLRTGTARDRRPEWEAGGPRKNSADRAAHVRGGRHATQGVTTHRHGRRFAQRAVHASLRSRDVVRGERGWLLRL